MRRINVLAAVSAALLMTGGASAKEKTDQPKPKKICRDQQMPGRITPRRVCRIVPPPESAAQDTTRKGDNARDAGTDRH